MSGAVVLEHPYRAWCVCSACRIERARRKDAPRQAFHAGQREAERVGRRHYVPREEKSLFVTHDSAVYQRDPKTGAIRRIGVAANEQHFDGKSAAIFVPTQGVRGKAARREEKRQRRLERARNSQLPNPNVEASCPR